jgi:hypothetical protein
MSGNNREQDLLQRRATEAANAATSTTGLHSGKPAK